MMELIRSIFALYGERSHWFLGLLWDHFLLSGQAILLSGAIGLLLGILSAKGILTAATGLLSPEIFLARDAGELNRLIAENSGGKGLFLLASAAITLVFALLASLPAGPLPKVRPAAYHGAVTVKRKAIEQNHLILAFPAPAYLDPRRPQVLLLNSLLGGGCSSRLFQELREERGLCYTVYSYVADHADTGLLGIYAAVSPDQERRALETARQVVLELAECDFGQWENKTAQELQHDPRFRQWMEGGGQSAPPEEAFGSGP